MDSILTEKAVQDWVNLIPPKPIEAIIITKYVWNTIEVTASNNKKYVLIHPVEFLRLENMIGERISLWLGHSYLYGIPVREDDKFAKELLVSVLVNISGKEE